MNTNLSFSIIIPTYNRGSFIEKSILSVLNQNYEHFEIIIVDDGSQDNTSEIVRRIRSKKIRYIYQSNKERAVARNRGILEAIGDYVTFLDSDDILYSHHLQQAALIISNSFDPPFVHLGYEIKDSSGRILSRINNRKGNLNLIEGNSLSCIGIFIRRDIAQQHLFNEDRRIIGSEDYELWMRLSARYSIVYSNEITAALIQHNARSVLSYKSDQLIERAMLTMKYIIEDEGFRQNFWQHRNRFIAHRYLYLALHLILESRIRLGIACWRKAVIKYPNVLFHRKTLGIFKNIILHIR